MGYGPDFESVKNDIRKHGQNEPIVILNGEILDGWHRYHATRELGIEPITRHGSVEHRQEEE